MAHEYGWSLEYITGLPYRHIFLLYTTMIRRRHEDKQFQASIHGVKLDDFDVLIKNSAPVEQLNAEQENIISKTLDKYFEQKTGG